MPYPRLLRSLVARPTTLPLLALASALAAGACHSKDKTEADPDNAAASASASASAAASDPSATPAPSASTAAADPSAAPEAKEDTPEVDQRNPKGGFVPPKDAPPPDPPVVIKPIAFDSVPPEINLAPVKDVDGHCGEIEVGGEKVLLDCMTDDYGAVPGAAKSLVSQEDLVGLKRQRDLPKTVDHRKDGTEGPIMSQGKTPACTAFSLIAVADHAAAHFLGHPGELSPMHAWARYHTPRMAAADNDNVGRGLTDLATLPWDPKVASSWQHGSRPEPGLIHRADAHSLVEITNITHLDAGNMHEIKAALAAGQDVWFSIKAAHGLQHTKKNADGESMVSHFDWHKVPASERSAHAIALAGYEETPKGTFFLIHNSWGPKWGTDGYAWIWEKTLHANIADAYVLHVKPLEGAHSKRQAHNHKFHSCGGGLAPDAATGQCVPPCGDNGPRVNGVCPKAGQCPEGEVNLDGRCELSAPILDKTLSNGVKMTCGVSGCSYVVPKGVASCTASEGCSVSCAAPRFMLGSGSHGLSCSG